MITIKTVQKRFIVTGVPSHTGSDYTEYYFNHNMGRNPTNIAIIKNSARYLADFYSDGGGAAFWNPNTSQNNNNIQVIRFHAAMGGTCEVILEFN